MVLGDSLSATGLVYILVCMFLGVIRFWQICVGVAIRSAFSSLMEPAYKATVTDLLTPEQYTKASGLVGVAGSAKYLISPVLAGYVFTPLLVEGGALADSVGRIVGTGSGRGTGLLIMVAGALLCVTAVVLYRMKSVRALEKAA